MLDKLGVYAKFFVATIAPVFVAIQAAATDGISTQEWYAIGVTAAVALGVLLKGNKPAVG